MGGIAEGGWREELFSLLCKTLNAAGIRKHNEVEPSRLLVVSLGDYIIDVAWDRKILEMLHQFGD